MLLWMRCSGIVVLSAPHDLLPVDGDGSRSCKIHRFDNHDLQFLVRNCRPVNVEKEVLSLDMTAVGEIDAKVELDSELG